MFYTQSTSMIMSELKGETWHVLHLVNQYGYIMVKGWNLTCLCCVNQDGYIMVKGYIRVKEWNLMFYTQSTSMIMSELKGETWHVLHLVNQKWLYQG